MNGFALSGSIILLLQFVGIIAAALAMSWLIGKVFPHWSDTPDEESWVNIWKDQA